MKPGQSFIPVMSHFLIFASPVHPLVLLWQTTTAIIRAFGEPLMEDSPGPNDQ